MTVTDTTCLNCSLGGGKMRQVVQGGTVRQVVPVGLGGGTARQVVGGGDSETSGTSWD